MDDRCRASARRLAARDAACGDPPAPDFCFAVRERRAPPPRGRAARARPRYRGIRGQARSPPRISTMPFTRPLHDPEARWRRTRAAPATTGRATTGRATTGREIAGRAATPITPEACPPTDRKPCDSATPGRSPLPLRRGRNRDSDRGGRGEKNALERGSSTPAARRDTALVGTAGVARPRRRASNESAGPRSKHCPNTEPRHGDGALHTTANEMAQLSHGRLSHGRAALRSRLPPSRRYGCERPCRWC
jgi:hypothetical protein